jgi:phage gpG-like protein
MGSTVTVKIDPNSPALKVIDRVKQRMDDPTPIMEKVSGWTLEEVKINFAEQGRPAKWKPRPPVSRGKHPLLNKTGLLIGLLRAKVEGKEAVVEINNRIAVIQNEGATLGKNTGWTWKTDAGKWMYSKSVTIPARPFMVLASESTEKIGNKAAAELEKELKG